MEKKANPVPQGKYVPATRFGQIICTAGMTARKNGVPVFTGRVMKDEPLETYREAVLQAVTNALTAAENKLCDDEKIHAVLSMTVYVNAEDGFTLHSKLADIASEYLCEKLGENGIAARAAIGVATLPGNAPVEISLICAAE